MEGRVVYCLRVSQACVLLPIKQIDRVEMTERYLNFTASTVPFPVWAIEIKKPSGSSYDNDVNSLSYHQ